MKLLYMGCLIMLLTACATTQPAKQQKISTPVSDTHATISVDQIDLDRDGHLSITEQQLIHSQPAHHVAIITFVCIAAAVCVTLIICMWFTRRGVNPDDPASDSSDSSDTSEPPEIDDGNGVILNHAPPQTPPDQADGGDWLDSEQDFMGDRRR